VRDAPGEARETLIRRSAYCADGGVKKAVLSGVGAYGTELVG
jgi:hypothetical protein